MYLEDINDPKFQTVVYYTNIPKKELYEMIFIARTGVDIHEVPEDLLGKPNSKGENGVFLPTKLNKPLPSLPGSAKTNSSLPEI
ncbi:MAG: hypothetical protein R3B93_01370 [Bacteroidia bacterium]